MTSKRGSRYASAAENMQRQSRRSDKAWNAFERSVIGFYGRSYGATIYEWIRRGEHDPVFACRKLLGVEPLPWIVNVWDAMRDHRYIPVRVGNAGAKTTNYMLTDMLASFYRWNVTPEWGSRDYRILHLAPQESQALEGKGKIDAILENRAQEQMYRIPGGFDSRPCLLTPFFIAGKPDGIHQGYHVIDEGYASITFRPTTYKAKGSDGTDPALVTWDELRHEKAFNEVLNTIIMARFLRVPFGRALFFFTSLGASVELLAAFERGRSGLEEDQDWYSLALDDLRAANPTVSDETIARANRNIDKRYLPMVMSGKPIQAQDAKFTLEAIAGMFYGTTEPKDLSDIVTIRQRVMARCAICLTPSSEVVHQNGERKHPIIGWVDPASSSAGADSIVAMAFDLHPPTFPSRWVDVCYVEELPTGTRIQRVAAHVAILSMVIHGICGFDQNSALGYNTTDNLIDFQSRESLFAEQGIKHIEKDLRERLARVDLADEPDIAPIEHNKKIEKDQDIAYAVALTDMDKVSSPHHLTFKQQLTNYVRKDTGIRQDFVMTFVGGLFIAKGEIPDVPEERKARDKGGRVKVKAEQRDDVYAGVGAHDPYFDLPGDIGETLGRIDAYAEEG